MPDISKGIFISYRRDPSRFLALHLADKLRGRGYDVFWDVDSIGSGKVEEIILSQIGAKAHFVVLLSHGTLERCNNPDDWLRREIEYAIELGRNLIPVLVDDFNFEKADKYLTGNLRQLRDYNALPLDYRYTEAAIERLCTQFLTNTDYGMVIPAAKETSEEVKSIIQDALDEPIPSEKMLSAEALYNQAIGQSLAGNFENALVDFTRVIELDPENVGAYSNRGKIYFQLGKYQDALNDFQQARSFFLQRNDDNPELLVLIAVAKYSSGEIQKAKDLMRDFLPNDRRFGDTDWIGKEYGWPKTLVKSARELITSLES